MEKDYKVVKSQDVWSELYFYQKANTLYHLTFVFAHRYLSNKDRTVDQMVQAARSGKQNIVEGLADGVTSSEMQLKLINVARASLHELREDYHDYLDSRQLKLWDSQHARYQSMLAFCREHNKIEEYRPYFEKWSDEEMCNIAITLCHMTDRMLSSYIKKLEKDFVENGGIKERMYNARTGYRNTVVEQLKAEIARLKSLLDSHNIKY